MAKSTTLKALGIAIAVIQILDIIIHAATDQLEVIRVVANMILLLWLAVAASGRVGAIFLSIAIGSIGLYLLLNLVFLAREGLTNVGQGGGLRVTLFALVFLTVTLSTALTFIYNKRSPA